jgi:hypothetical protein
MNMPRDIFVTPSLGFVLALLALFVVVGLLLLGRLQWEIALPLALLAIARLT